ncbi:MAG: PLP-dependent aminotransferase family protein [Chloroflexi bacterium]|nr:PLP-dependent aminotransferase family protein [Chloroflexota bacterium]
MSEFNYGAVLSAASAPTPNVAPVKAPPANGRFQFAGGKPDPVSFPYDGLAAATAQVMAEDGAEALTYGDAQGFRPLRELIARKYAHYENLTVSPDQIVVSNGSSDALRLVCSALLDPGDTVLIEAPTFLGTLRTLQGHRVDLVGLPMDDDGIIVDEMAAIIQRERDRGKQVKLLYTIPTFQNPGGSTMPLARRRALLEVAARAGLVVMEDDAYGDLRSEGEFVPSLFALDEQGIVARTGTMSKILGAGLRIGWVVAQPPLVRAMLAVKFDGGTSPFTSRVVHAYMAEQLEDHAEELIQVYTTKRDAMLEALDEHVGTERGARWLRPQGGFFIWVRLPDNCDPARLVDTCTARGVAYVPGPAFYSNWQADWPEAERYIRLAYSYEQPETIREGIAQLGRAILEASH